MPETHLNYPLLNTLPVHDCGKTQGSSSNTVYLQRGSKVAARAVLTASTLGVGSNNYVYMTLAVAARAAAFCYRQQQSGTDSSLIIIINTKQTKPSVK